MFVATHCDPSVLRLIGAEARRLDVLRVVQRVPAVELIYTVGFKFDQQYNTVTRIGFKIAGAQTVHEQCNNICIFNSQVNWGQEQQDVEGKYLLCGEGSLAFFLHISHIPGHTELVRRELLRPH